MYGIIDSFSESDTFLNLHKEHTSYIVCINEGMVCYLDWIDDQSSNCDAQNQLLVLKVIQYFKYFDVSNKYSYFSLIKYCLAVAGFYHVII